MKKIDGKKSDKGYIKASKLIKALKTKTMLPQGLYYKRRLVSIKEC